MSVQGSHKRSHGPIPTYHKKAERNCQAISSFIGDMIEREKRKPKWPPTDDLCVGGYWKGKKN